MAKNKAIVDRIKKLLERKENLIPILEGNQIVDDVLTGREAIVGKRSQSSVPFKWNAISGTAKRNEVKNSYNESKYLKRNATEYPQEYSKRLEMTPFFSETAPILQQRQGSLFKKPPTTKLPDALKDFDKNCTANGATIDDTIAKIAEFSQTEGFCGILIDREALPADVVDPKTKAARKVSVAEAQKRKLGRVIWALYPAPQILNFQQDARGLTWVKLVEESCIQDSWDAEEIYVKTVRVIDRKTITVYRIKSDEYFAIGAEPPDEVSVEEDKPIPHNHVDEQNNPLCPFQFFHPFPARDGIGRSILKGCAEADIAATRILSAIVWVLHLHGCPILSLLTHKEPDKIADIGVGSSSLWVLAAGNTNSGKANEAGAYVTLDTGGVEKLIEVYEKLVAKAKEQAEKATGAGISGPKEQSGISKAWTFKTGEERILFLLSICLKQGIEWLLKATARISGADPDAVSCVFPQSYDVEGPIEVVDLVNQVLPVLDRYKLVKARVEVLRKLLQSVLEDTSLADGKDIEEELKKTLDIDLSADSMLNGAVPPDESEADLASDAKKQAAKQKTNDE